MNRQELKKHAWNLLLTNLENRDSALHVHYLIEFASHRKHKKTTFSKNTSVPEFVFQVMLGWRLAIFE